MNDRRNNFLLGDQPLSDPGEGALGRKILAENLAKGLLRMAGPEGHVVAIFGPWGSGKSTLLKFVQQFIKQIPDPPRPIVVEFNPW